MMIFREIDSDQFYDALWWPQRTLSFSFGNVTHPLWCGMQPPRLQHAQCRISITQQRPNCTFNCSETREIKAKTSKWRRQQSEKAVRFQGVVWPLDQHHYHHHHHHHHQPQQRSCCCQSGPSVPVMYKLHISAASAMNKLIELIRMVEKTCFLQISADCCSIL